MSVTTSFPSLTTVGSGLFQDVSAAGFIQGHAQPDPSTIWRLRGGFLLNAETLPMWGGIPLFYDVPTGGLTNPNQALGPGVGRATTVTGGSKPILGWSVFDQQYGAVQSPASPVPLVGSYSQVMTYPTGSLARIAVACDPVLAAALGGGLSNQQVAWDFVNEWLIPYTGSLTVTAGTYNSGNGHVVLTATAHGMNVGDTVTVSGATGSGGDLAAINGTFTITAVTANTFTYVIATGLTITITGATASTGPALPVSILAAQSSGCMTVNYSSGAGTASWNFSGACALIQV